LSPVETALQIDRDTPLHMKLGLAASIGVIIFLGGRWSESKLHDFEQLQGEVSHLASEVRDLRAEIQTRNEDLAVLTTMLRNHDGFTDRVDVAAKRAVRRSPSLYEGAARQGLSRLDGE